jgi:ribonuclease R
VAKRNKSAAAKKTNVPSEEEILEFVRTQPGRVGKREISRAFGVKGNDRIELKRMLRKMKDDGVLAKDRGRLSKPGTLPSVAVIDIVERDVDGELIAVPHTWDRTAHGEPPKIVVSIDRTGLRQTGRAPAEGDRILARIRETGDEGPGTYPYEAHAIRTLTRAAGMVLGVIAKSKSEGTRIIPIDKRARSELALDGNFDAGALPGELVSAEIVRDRPLGPPRARVKERLGKIGDHRSISLIAIHQHGLPHRFSEAAIGEAERAEPVGTGTLQDLREIPLITIDPADARDHDDAVWACDDDDPANEGGFRVIVAIADVAHYVRPGSALDREARERGNSVYFPDRVEPMLPERLSADLCSLRPGEDRPALAVTMVFNHNGTKTGHAFSRVLMRSAAKLSYQQAQNAADGQADADTRPLCAPVLEPLWRAYRTVDKARAKRAPLALDLPERRIVFDKDGNIAGVVVPPRLEAHKLIEEFMIQANVCAAETLEAQASPLVYRVHEAPAADRVDALADFLKSMDLNFAKGQTIKPRQFNQILAKVVGKDIEHLVNQVVLRTQAQAAYSPDNRGHFGLNLRRYAHFTSPIRRYADLIVHRALISALKLGGGGLSEWDVEHLHETAELISAAERRAMTAERDTVDRLIASHLSSRVGSDFSGRIAGVTQAGLFVELPETGANGFVPISTVGNDFFHHDVSTHALVGERTGETYRLGDPVDVRLLEVTPLAGGMRFELLSPGRPGKPHRPRPQSRQPRARGRRHTK